MEGTIEGTFVNPNVDMSLEGFLVEGTYTGKVSGNTITGTVSYSLLGFQFSSDLKLTRQ